MFAQSFEMSTCACGATAVSGVGTQASFSAFSLPSQIASFSVFLSRQSDCHNYPRVFSSLDNDTRFLLCGTNAFSPRCRFYFKANPWSSNLVLEKEFSGRGFCPYDPRHNSTAIFTGKW